MVGLESKRIPNLAAYYWLNRKGLLEEIESYESKFFNKNGPHSEIIKELNFLINKIASVNLSLDKNNLLKQKIFLEKKLYKLMPKLKPRNFKVEEVINVIPKDGVLI